MQTLRLLHKNALWLHQERQVLLVYQLHQHKLWCLYILQTRSTDRSLISRRKQAPAMQMKQYSLRQRPQANLQHRHSHSKAQQHSHRLHNQSSAAALSSRSTAA